MVYITINDESFSYDVYSLVKAFYQNEEVKIEVEAGHDECPFSVGFCFGDGDCGDGLGGFENGGENRIEVPYEGEERKDFKNKIKRVIYKYLVDKTGRELPWGTLTGIRPTKLPMEMLNDNACYFNDGGCDKNEDCLESNETETARDEKIKRELQSTYLISDEKVELSIEIAKREKGIIDKLHKDDGYSLYIGIPFCPTTCMYCSFTSFPISKWKNRVDEYIAALKKEIDYVAEEYAGYHNYTDNQGMYDRNEKNRINNKTSNYSDCCNDDINKNYNNNSNNNKCYQITTGKKKLDSIYIGGGTPTTLDAERIRDLLLFINERLDVSGLKEFSVEAGRPDSITEDKLRALKDGGVTRISVNPQTMNDETLKVIGRAHTVDDFYRAYELARKYFDNINIDLIMGLPGEDEKMVMHTFKAIEELKPNSLTVHSMAIKRAAHMDEFLKAHPEIKSEITDGMMRELHRFTKRCGLEPYYLYRQKNMTGNYENIGFARPGFEGIYNISIMEEVQSIVALGAGSVSKHVYNAAHTPAPHPISRTPVPSNISPDASINIDKQNTTNSYNQTSNLTVNSTISNDNNIKNDKSKQTYNLTINNEKSDDINKDTIKKTNDAESANNGIRIERCDNVKDVNLYIEKIDEMIGRKRRLFC